MQYAVSEYAGIFMDDPSDGLNPNSNGAKTFTIPFITMPLYPTYVWGPAIVVE